MKFVNIFAAGCVIVFLFAAVFAQHGHASDEVLATVAGKSIAVNQLASEAQEAFANRRDYIAAQRLRLFEQFKAELALETESTATGVAPQKLVADRSAEQLDEYLAGLARKHKIADAKPIDAATLKPTDVVLTIGTRKITAKEFDERYRIQLNDAEWNVAELVLNALEDAIYRAALEAEAAARNTDTGAVIAAEVTDKMRDFSPEEYESLTTAFRSSLSKKYPAKILFKQPETIRQQISVDDDPSFGPANAPVTVVMFSDMQCPACAATHPVVKDVVAEFGEKVRFVVRDFPLVNIHPHALEAAAAANAAYKQGKYWDYIEILYRHQDEFGTAAFKRFAAEAGLNEQRFAIDLTDEKAVDEIRSDVADGESYGVSATPTIFINGLKVRQLTGKSIRKAIREELAGTGVN